MTTKRFAYSPSALRTAYNWALAGLPLLLAVVGLAFLAPVAASNDTSLWSVLFYSKDGGLDWEFVALITTLITVAAVVVLVKQGRVSLDDQGLQLTMPPATGAGLLGLSTGHHSVAWDQVRSFRTETPSSPQNLANALAQSRLVITTDSGEYRVQPYHYVALDGPDHRMGFRDMLRKPEKHLDELINSAPLVQAVRERVGEDSEEPANADPKKTLELPVGATYNLFHHKGMVVQLALLILLGGYALVDFLFLTSFSVIGSVPVLPFVSSAIAAAALCVVLGRSAPVAERVGVAGLVVAAALAATYPGLMRHALMTTPEPDELSYRAVETAVFEHPQAPKLDFSDRNLDAFWEETAPVGTTYPFRVHSAETGVQVLDLRPVHSRTRAFYEARNNG